MTLLVVVLLREGGDLDSALSLFAARPLHVYRHAVFGFAVEATEAELRVLADHPDVTSVEVSVPVIPQANQGPVATGPRSHRTWWLNRVNQDTENGVYSTRADGAGVTVWLIDGGIRADHAEFGGRAYLSADVSPSNLAPGAVNSDSSGHGTGCAALAVGAYVGVARKANVRMIKFNNSDSSAGLSSMVAALDHFALNAVQPCVLSISQALTAPSTGAVATAVTSLWNAGYFVAVAAGNDFGDVAPRTPANAAKVCTVAASDRLDLRWSSTDVNGNNRGSNAGPEVDLWGPGSSMLQPGNGNPGDYGSFGGTSSATPVVAGTVALWLSRFGYAPPDVILSWLKRHARPVINVANTTNLLVHHDGLL